jgi:hypothetical protein
MILLKLNIPGQQGFDFLQGIGFGNTADDILNIACRFELVGLRVSIKE